MTKYIQYLLAASLLSLSMIGCLNSSDSKTSSSPSTVKKVFAYTGSQYTNSIYSFQVDKASGSLSATATASVAAETLPMILAATYDKKFLVAANYSSNSISVFSIDQAEGSLTLVGHTPVGATGTAWIVSHPTQSTVYTANAGSASIAIIDIDSSGVATVRTTVAAGSGVTALAISSDGNYLYSADQNVNQVSRYSVDGSGGLTLLGATSLAGASPNHLILNNAGTRLYVGNWGGGGTVEAFTISAGSLTALNGPVATGGNVYTVSLSPDETTLYANQPYSNQFSVHALDNTGIGASGSTVSLAGIVNMSFWEDFAFLSSWSNGSTPLPILTRDVSDMGGANLQSSSTSYTGLYQLCLVEIDQ